MDKLSNLFYILFNLARSVNAPGGVYQYTVPGLSLHQVWINFIFTPRRQRTMSWNRHGSYS
jgi:hypothetical protein